MMRTFFSQNNDYEIRGDNRRELGAQLSVSKRELIENDCNTRSIEILRAEQWKAFTAFLLLVASFFLTSLSLALTHQRLPDPKHEPLPDIFLDNVESIDFLLNVSEVQIIAVVNLTVALIFFHKFRFLIAKRCFLMLSILYLYRSITFYVTVLPISSQSYYCSPKLNSTTATGVIKRALSVYSGMGLSINNKQTLCGDSIFSGHATVLVFSYLVIKEYTPNKLKFLHVLALLNAAIGILFLLISHSHYSVDVIIAYYITTRLFWTYHSLCLSSNISSKTPLMREWWSFMFDYFDKHSHRTITNELEVPWPLSLKFSFNKD